MAKKNQDLHFDCVILGSTYSAYLHALYAVNAGLKTAWLTPQITQIIQEKQPKDSGSPETQKPSFSSLQLEDMWPWIAVKETNPSTDNLDQYFEFKNIEANLLTYKKGKMRPFNGFELKNKNLRDCLPYCMGESFLSFQENIEAIEGLIHMPSVSAQTWNSSDDKIESLLTDSGQVITAQSWVLGSHPEMWRPSSLNSLPFQSIIGVKKDTSIPGFIVQFQKKEEYKNAQQEEQASTQIWVVEGDKKNPSPSIICKQSDQISSFCPQFSDKDDVFESASKKLKELERFATKHFGNQWEHTKISWKKTMIGSLNIDQKKGWSDKLQNVFLAYEAFSPECSWYGISDRLKLWNKYLEQFKSTPSEEAAGPAGLGDLTPINEEDLSSETIASL